MAKEQQENKLNLKEILKLIKIENKTEYLQDLIKNNKIKSIIGGIVRKYNYNLTDIKQITENLVMEYTIRYYEYTEDYTEEKYINFIRKYLGRKVKSMIFDWDYPQEILIDFQDNYDTFAIEDFTDKLIENIDLKNAIGQLNQQEQNVINKIFYDGYSEEEVAIDMSITQQRVNQIKLKSLEKIKKILKSYC